ncbi:MAG: putative acyltransferase [Saprospiraceae bacterium]|jgi:predicted acyltransferase
MGNKRIASIDILRALTMLLMIWVNDFWSIIGVPKWLQHAEWGEDYLGFSDIIFPLFLFIVGLSIPLAIEQGRTKGLVSTSIAKQVIIRSASLLVIGFFMVNYETIHTESLLINKMGYFVIMTIAVVLIWMHWKRTPVPVKWHLPLQLLGVVLLVFLAVIYKGGDDGELWMTGQWWGILGLIGWAYLINALLFILFRGNFAAIIGLFLLFSTLSVLSHSNYLPALPEYLSFLNTIYSGTIPAIATAGMVALLLVRKLAKEHSQWIFPALIILGGLTISFGIGTRPIWGISKMSGTPSWLGICVGIAFILFAINYVIADVKKKTKWANLIGAAGTATLTCYILYPIINPLKDVIGIILPESFHQGFIGLLYSFIFAVITVLIVGWIEKKGFKLKL